MSQAFYRKWRPKLWDQVIGQDHVIHTIQNAIRAGRIAHAYLFAGPRGTGKTSTARLLAKAINCLDEDIQNRPCNQCANCTAVNEGRFLDLLEIDAASNTSVDDVRDLRDKINFSPSQGKYKVYIIDEVHMLSTAAFNALLKTLEEPPPHAIFILATTEVHKIPATVLSRCQRYEFRRIPLQEIEKMLGQIASEERLDYDPEALRVIARQATGSLRDAISLLDQMSSTGQKITLEFAQQVLGTATNQAVVELVEAILKKQAAEGMDIIHAVLDGGSDPRQFARQTVEYLRNVLLVKLGNEKQVDAPQEIKERMSQHAAQLRVERLITTIDQFNQAAVDTTSGWYPGLQLELAFAKMVDEEITHLQTATPRIPQPAAVSPSSKEPSRGVSSQPVPPARASEETHRVSESPESTEAAAPVTPQRVDLPQPGATPPAESSQMDENTALALILKRWKDIVNEARHINHLTSGLLLSAKPLWIKENVLVLGFASDLVQSKMEDGKNIEIASKAIYKITGLKVHVRCTVTGKEQNINFDTLPNGEDGSLVNEAIQLGGRIKQKK